MSNSQEFNLNAWIDQTKTMIFLGAGGVGKTTSSILFALLAIRLGKRVGLISVDPAKRLAKALNIPLDGSLKSVDMVGLQAHSGRALGSLKACILDQEQVFNEMVRQYAPSAGVANKILENSLYKATASNLGGASEYMALAKLHQMEKSKEFDLIIVDTPPDVHAIDFISRPNILANFFEQGVVSWLLKPFSIAQKLGAGRLISFGEKMMGGLASITGVQALHKLADFILLMSEVMQGFNQAGNNLKKILSEDTCKLLIVSSPRTSAFRTSLDLLSAIRKLGLRVDALLMNRLPNYSQIFLDLNESECIGGDERVHYQKALEAQKLSVDQFIQDWKDRSQFQDKKPLILKNIDSEYSLETMATLVQAACSIETLS